MAITVKQLIEKDVFQVLEPGNPARTIEEVFCCDLLSIAMSKCPADAAWITVMSNMNTLAVATLADATAIILAEGVQADEKLIEKAKTEGVTLCRTELPIFAAGLQIRELICNG